MYWSFNSYQEKHLLQDSWLWEADTFQRSHTCLGKWSNGNCGKIQSTTREKRKEPGVTSLPHVLHSWEYINTAQVLRVCWKTDIISTFTREQANIHLKAPGGQSPAQTHAAALLCAHAKTHTHTQQQETHFCTTDFDVTSTDTYISLRRSHSHKALFCTQRYQN